MSRNPSSVPLQYVGCADLNEKNNAMPESIAHDKNDDSLKRMEDPNSLAHIRHTLHTPLNQILGYAEMIQEEHGNTLPGGIKDELKKIHTAGSQLLAMIQDGLAAWKLEMGKVDLNGMKLEAQTPLSLIVGFSEVSEEIAGGSGLDAVLADLKKITGAAKNLQALFDSISFPDSIEVQQKIAREPPPPPPFSIAPPPERNWNSCPGLS